jgi:uncharacterized protein (UPF0147 family)
MTDGLVDLTRRDVLRLAADDIARARRQLDLSGEAAIAAVRMHLEIAIARLQPVAIDDELPREVRRAVERCRATLSSHLLAADNLEAVGVEATMVVALLRRATDAGALEAAAAVEPRDHADR